MSATSKFLTEPEVAEILRCSPSKIKRLRLGGQLAYIPGRPVLISEDDIRQYLDSIRCQAAPLGDKSEPGGQIQDPVRWAVEAHRKRRERQARKLARG